MLELGMLCVVKYLLDERDNIANRRTIACKSILFWSFGYGLTALLRQLYVYLILGEQIGMGKMASWSEAAIWQRCVAFLYPIRWMLDRASLFVIVIVIVICIILLIRKQMNLSKEWFAKSLRLIMFSFMFPFVWCAILVNAVGHSFYLQNYVPVCFTVVYSLLSALRLFEKRKINE